MKKSAAKPAWAMAVFLLIALCAQSSIASTPVAIIDPEVLAQLESSGLGIGTFFPSTKASSSTARDLAENPVYRGITESLQRDLSALKKSDSKLSVTMKTSHRLFNADWLTSSAALFELAGVVNRMDRKPFNPGTCGEIRLIYRLAYDVKDKGYTIHSRLPFTINMVFLIKADQDNTCKNSIEKWDTFFANVQKRANNNPTELLNLNKTSLKSIEVNMQSVRWPSTTRGDLGAHAEYLLRVFHIENNRPRLSPLENTPAVERISKNPAQKRALLKWIYANASQIDQGTALTPTEFLTTTTTSFSPRGLNRIANRPWSAIFTIDDFRSINFEKLTYLKSPAALLRRLDDSSCAGCHQNRSVAGFHLIGIDRKGTSPHNAIAVSGSPHFTADLLRRTRYFSDLKTKNAADNFRPLSERASDDAGGFGAHCGLGDLGFSTWTCAPGLKCEAFGLAKNDNTVGQCFPATNTAAIGGPCEIGVMTAHRNPHKDRVKSTQELTCSGSGICESNYVGFPEGMCAQSCDSKSKDMACGSIALLAGFNECLGKGLPFTKCLAENTRPAGLRACSEDIPCRDDYICSGPAGTTGTCIPPYFLFQMRVDGHPTPRS